MRGRSSRIVLIVVVALVLFASFALVACVGSSSAGTSSSGATSGSSDGAALVQAKCGQCHSAQQALAIKGKPKAMVEAVVNQMVGKGAQLTPDEQTAVVTYLSSPN